MSDSRPLLYLHIGAAKSGSSAIQAALRRNASLLADRGLLVPTPVLGVHGRVSGGHVIAFEGLRPVTAAGIAQVTDDLGRLAQHVRSHGQRGVVVSAENLINNPDLPRLFAPALDQFDIRVVIYIRRQDEYLIGAWSQWYFKDNPDFRAWVDEVVQRGLGNWDAIIGWWADGLPSATLDVRVFDRALFPDGDIGRDFMSVLNVDAQGLDFQVDSVNRTLNEIAMNVAARNRDLFADTQDHGFLEFLATLGGEAAVQEVNSGLFFDADGRRAVVEAYAASNERVRAKYFPDLPPGSLFKPVEDESQLVSRESAHERELDLLWHILYRLYEDRSDRPG